MQDQEQEHERRENHDMEREGPGQGQLSDDISPPDEIFQGVPHDRDRRHAVGPDRGGPVGDLVPGEEISGEAEREGEEQQDHPVDPGDVARGPRNNFV